MKHVIDLMNHAPPTVRPDLTVHGLAEKLLESGRDGYCVVDDSGALIGIVTVMDVIFQEKRLRLPSFFTFLDSMVPLGTQRAHAEMARISGATVADIMTREVVGVREGTPLDELATLMVERHLSLLPVLRDGELVGEVTRTRVLEAIVGAHSRHAG